MTIVNTRSEAITTGFVKTEKFNCFPARMLKALSEEPMINSASVMERKLYIKDSVINWKMRRDLNAPTVFRTPTSFARLADLAVERFIKLMHAIRIIKAAMAAKMYRY